MRFAALSMTTLVDREHQRAERGTLALVGVFADRMPAIDVAWLESLVASGEPGIAFEDLCLRLFESGVPVTPHELVELAVVGAHARVDAAYWQCFLRVD
jgi:hypothetical protein